MLVDEIWDFKSLNMGRELEIAGEFIYDSAQKAMAIRGLNNSYEINIILYIQDCDGKLCGKCQHDGYCNALHLSEKQHAYIDSDIHSSIYL